MLTYACCLIWFLLGCTALGVITATLRREMRPARIGRR